MRECSFLWWSWLRWTSGFPSFLRKLYVSCFGTEADILLGFCHFRTALIFRSRIVTARRWVAETPTASAVRPIRLTWRHTGGPVPRIPYRHFWQCTRVNYDRQQLFVTRRAESPQKCGNNSSFSASPKNAEAQDRRVIKSCQEEYFRAVLRQNDIFPCDWPNAK